MKRHFPSNCCRNTYYLQCNKFSVMMSSSSRDSWERLVAAVLKRDQIWQLCHRSPSISTIASDDSSEQFLSFSSNNLESISVNPQTGSVSQADVEDIRQPLPKRIMRKLFLAWNQRRKPQDEDLVHIPEDLAIHLERLRRFSLHELQVATEDFSKRNRLPYARYVYGGCLAGGFQVAVKGYNGNGSLNAELHFKREVEINSIVAHRNVLHIVGFCITPKHWLLVYPLMVGGCAASWLRDRNESQLPLNWPTRKGIALGVAKGVAHLHEECDKKILHREIRASKILLNEYFEAAVAYIELGVVAEHSATYIEDGVLGSSGHIAPEYLATGKCSEKSDVFEYGMFLLELITGQRNFDLTRLAHDEDALLLDWVKRNYEKRKWEIMVDADCGGNFMEDVVEQLTHIALICTSRFPGERPMMSEVVRMIENEDCLAERWREWYWNNVLVKYDYHDWIIDDDTVNLAPEEPVAICSGSGWSNVEVLES